MRRVLVVVVVALFGIALAASANEPIVVPKGEKTAQQQTLDKGECSDFAKKTSGFDPLSPPPPPQPAPVSTGPDGSAVRGAARGATVGAIGGAIGNDAGKGAAVGAGVGAAAGRMRSNAAARQTAAANADAQAQYQQQLAALRSEWNRAFAACMEARDYVVK